MFCFRLQQPALGEHAAKDHGIAMRGTTPSTLNTPQASQHSSSAPPKSSFVGGNRNGNAGGAMRSARVKVDRVGAGSSGGGGESHSEAGSGAGGMRVVRPVSGGTTRRARGIALPHEGVNDEDTSIVSDGSSVGTLERNKAAGTVAGLRVRCGTAAAFNGSGTTEAMVHHSGGGAGGGSSSSGSSDFHLAAGRALRVARRVPSTAAQSGAAAVTDGKVPGREGGTGNSSGGGALRVVGRQLKGASPKTGALTADGEQQQRDACAERMKVGSSEELREVAAPATLNRREILRKVKDVELQHAQSYLAFKEGVRPIGHYLAGRVYHMLRFAPLG